MQNVKLWPRTELSVSWLSVGVSWLSVGIWDIGGIGVKRDIAINALDALIFGNQFIQHQFLQ